MLFNDFGTAFGGRIFDLRINYRVIAQVNEQVSFLGPVLENQVRHCGEAVIAQIKYKGVEA